MLQLRVVVDTTVDEGKWVRLDAFTLVVNAHGGLLEMSLKVNKEQKLLLTNPAVSAQEWCRVVGVRKSQDGYFAVAFEFDSPAPQFWPIALPPADWKMVQAEN
jgi:hypothetical protein